MRHLIFGADGSHADYTGHQPGKTVHPMVSLTYTLTPGLASDDLPDGRDIDATVTLSPPAEPAVVSMAGEREMGVGPSPRTAPSGPSRGD